MKCGSRSGPATHSVLTSADSGTIWPVFDRVYRRVRSPGVSRYLASDWTITHQTRLNWLYWLTVSEPNCAWIAL